MTTFWSCFLEQANIYEGTQALMIWLADSVPLALKDFYYTMLYNMITDRNRGKDAKSPWCNYIFIAFAKHFFVRGKGQMGSIIQRKLKK